MIANEADLNTSLRNLRIMHDALQDMRNKLDYTNPELMDARTREYLTRIAKIHAEITEFVEAHPDTQAVVSARD